MSRATLIVSFIHPFNDIKDLKVFFLFWSKDILLMNTYVYAYTSICSNIGLVWHQLLSFIECLQLFQNSWCLTSSMSVGAALAFPPILCLTCARGRTMKCSFYLSTYVFCGPFSNTFWKYSSWKTAVSRVKNLFYLHSCILVIANISLGFLLFFLFYCFFWSSLNMR